MFTNKKFVLFITKTKLTVARVTTGKKPKEERLEKHDWTHETLLSQLATIKKTITSTVRVLLSEDFVYVVNVNLSQKDSSDKEAIQHAAQEFIPENLSETAWYFLQVKQNTKKNNNGAFVKIQVVAVVRSLFEVLQTAILKTDMHVEAMEPLSHALARFSKEQNQPTLFVYLHNNEALFVLAENSIVIATQRDHSILTPSSLSQFLSFIKKAHDITPKKFIIGGDLRNVSLPLFKKEGFKLEVHELSPLISLAYKQDESIEDKGMLSLFKTKLPPIQEKQTLEAKSTENQKSNTTKNSAQVNLSNEHSNSRFIQKSIILIVCLIVLFVVVASMVILKIIPFQELQKKITTPTPSKIPSKTIPIPTQTQTPIDVSSYTITVLNGSGIQGEAARVSDLLKENGFTVPTTDNADSSDFTTTQLQYKETVRDEVKKILDKLLRTTYDLSVGETLSSQLESDIIITIGSNKKISQ